MPATKIKTRICRGCGKTETGISRNLTTQFCSKECWRVNMAGKYLRRGQSYQCSNCGEEFYRRPGCVRHAQQFCSNSCRIAQKSSVVTKTCPTCRISFTTLRYLKTTYCSQRCSKLGNNNPNYKEESSGRQRGASDHWRRYVFQRDNYTCQACGQWGGRLHPHHKDGFHWAVERRADLSNGVTLCVPCHTDFHNIYGRQNNTEAQFSEWIATKRRAA